jgi:surface protein
MKTIFYNTVNHNISKYLPKVIHDNILDENIPEENVKKLIIINKSKIQSKTKFEYLEDIQYIFTSNEVICGESMRYVFHNSKFNGDISNWDTSNVKNMAGMFSYSKFNKDISNWNTSNVKIMWSMFKNANFNGDISNWDTSNVENMWGMFKNSKFNGDISNWNTSAVFDMRFMYYGSNFNGDSNNCKNYSCLHWDTSNVEKKYCMFENSPFKN